MWKQRIPSADSIKWPKQDFLPSEKQVSASSTKTNTLSQLIIGHKGRCNNTCILPCIA